MAIVTGTGSATVIGLLLASLGAALGFYLLNNPEALERVLIWFETFPGNLEAPVRHAREAAAAVPGWIRSRPEEFPANLKANWNDLRQEARQFPTRFLNKMRQLGRLLRSLPDRLRRDWAVRRQEARELLARFTGGGRRVALLFDRGRCNLAARWAALQGEGVRRARLLIRKVFSLSRRLH